VRRFRSNSEGYRGRQVHLKIEQRNYSEERVEVEKTKKLQKKLQRGTPI